MKTKPAHEWEGLTTDNCGQPMINTFPRDIQGFKDRQINIDFEVKENQLNAKELELLAYIKDKVFKEIAKRFVGNPKSLFAQPKGAKLPFFVRKYEDNPTDLQEAALEKALSKLTKKS